MPASSHAFRRIGVHSHGRLASAYTSYTDFFHAAWWERDRPSDSNPRLLTILGARKFWNLAASAPDFATSRISFRARSRSLSWFAEMSAMKYVGSPSPTHRFAIWIRAMLSPASTRLQLVQIAFVPQLFEAHEPHAHIRQVAAQQLADQVRPQGRAPGTRRSELRPPQGRGEDGVFGISKPSRHPLGKPVLREGLGPRHVIDAFQSAIQQLQEDIAEVVHQNRRKNNVLKSGDPGACLELTEYPLRQARLGLLDAPAVDVRSHDQALREFRSRRSFAIRF